MKITTEIQRNVKLQFRAKLLRGYTGRRSRVRLRTALEPHFPNFSLNLDFQDSENETPNKRIIELTDEELEKSIDALFFSLFRRYMTLGLRTNLGVVNT